MFAYNNIINNTNNTVQIDLQYRFQQTDIKYVIVQPGKYW